MSVEPQVLGSSCVAGVCGGTASTLTNTGNPLLVSFICALAILVTLGVITRLSQRRSN